MRFLLQAIDLANECDLKYKSSKNQRLLVELTLMQIASITFDGEKKNNKPYIIAAIHFESKIKKRTFSKQIPTYQKPEKAPELPKTEAKTVKIISKPILQSTARRPSALSLTSINRKKELEKIEVEYDQVEGLPTDNFSESEAILAWKKYTALLLDKGKKSLTAVMNANKPYVKDLNLHFDLPNHLMKDQLERGKHPLLKFIREQLNNFKVDLILHVNEEETKKYAYTPQEKFEKLKEKNKAMELLKKTFDLDL